MSFKIPDSAEFQLKVSDVDLLIGAETLKDVTVIENVRETVPSITVTFLDDKSAAGSFGLFQDGAQMSVTVGDGRNQPNQYMFRQWTLEDAQATASGDMVTIHGVADLIPWFTQVVTKYHEGDTVRVIKELARIAKIPKVIAEVSTQDKMVHLPDGRTLSQFARYLVDHAWIGDKASPFMALTSENGEWALRISDILKGGQSPSVRMASAGLARQGEIVIWDYRIRSNSGPLNKFVNYGYKVVQEKLGGDADVFKNMDISKLSSSLGINSDISRLVDVARTLYHPTDVGNTHKNFVKALHHNRKARATFTTIVNTLTSELTSVRLMDDVEIRLARSNGDEDRAYSGTYKVTAIARHISRGSFREKLELSSQGVSEDIGGLGA